CNFNDVFDIIHKTLGAVGFYQKNGYAYKNYMTINLPDGNCLCYLEMVKNINDYTIDVTR
ncbi:MAG: hypothetical protein LBI04_11275, partial [Treponema sp.]|nr:hypothetical protein [Treponema sp.]